MRKLGSILLLTFLMGAVQSQAAERERSLVTNAPDPSLSRSSGAAVGVESAGVAPSTAPGGTWSSGIYAYDASGNIKSIGTVRYVYDAASRLVEGGVRGDSRTQTYSYDAFGNMTRIATTGNPWPRVLAVDSTTNRIDKITPETNVSGTFDAAGNQVGANGSTIGVFDAVGSMTSRGQAQYIYTADDERLATTDASRSFWRWTLRGLDHKVLREAVETVSGTTRTWTWTRDYAYRDSQLLASWAADGTGTRALHYHVDHLGTPRLITDANAVKVSSDDLFAFGEDPSVLPGDPERMHFTGHERDYAGTPSPNSADYLDYMHARYYSPAWGRFLSVDPVLDIKRSIREPKSWNRYSYVVNNPINRIDPDGRMDGNGMGEPVEWRCPGCTRAEALEQSNQIAGGTAGLAAAFGSLFIPGPEDLAVGAFVASRAGGAVVRFFGRLLARGDSAADAVKLSRYDDVTTGRSIANRSTNVSRADFGKNLEANGFTKSVSKDGKVTIYEKDGMKYTVRDSSKSTGGPSAEVFKDGKLVQKIRLEAEPK